MKNKLKEFKIDLGGCFPAKSKVVRKHAVSIGYAHVDTTDFLKSRFVSFSSHGHSYSEDRKFNTTVPNATLITVEKFLELTKADVVFKEPQKITITKEALEIAVMDVLGGIAYRMAADRIARQLGFTDNE
jgi:hypothetical protein